MKPHDHDPFFRAVAAPAFHRDLIADLAAGRCAAIQVPQFASPAVCEEIFAALSKAEFETYATERVYPPVMRFGVGVSDHRRDGRLADSYWDALRRSQEDWDRLGLTFDPFATCRDGLGSHWPGGVEIARHGARELAPGVAREPNHGFQVHYDNSLREFTGGLLDANLVAQFAFNLYLSVPPSGGETVVWRHRWQPGDEAHRLPSSYGYAEEVVGDVESFELTPEIGQALLFDPSNFHAVRPSRDGRRIALGFSVGLSDAGVMLAWG